MSAVNVLLALHLLGAVVWVGGMAFAYLVLRPSLIVLEQSQRLALLAQVFRRFFLFVWHAMPIMLLTGYAMIFGVLGGLSRANWAVHTMHLFGLMMAVLFLVIFFGPWKDMRAAVARTDTAAATLALDRIRLLIRINLVLGLLTVAVAAWAG